MYELLDNQVEALTEKVEGWSARPDFAYFTLERLTSGAAGESAQIQIEKLMGEVCADLGPAAIVDRLLDDKHLQRRGRLQVTAHFWDEAGASEDPYKRRKKTMRVVSATDGARGEAAATRGGDHRVLDSAAEMIGRVGERNDFLVDRVLVSANDGAKATIQQSEARLADHLNHHSALMELHRSNLETKMELWKERNAGVFVGLAKLDPSDREIILKTASGILGELIEYLKVAAEERRKTAELDRAKQAAEIKILQVELAKKRAGIAEPAPEPEPVAAPA